MFNYIETRYITIGYLSPLILLVMLLLGGCASNPEHTASLTNINVPINRLTNLTKSKSLLKHPTNQKQRFNAAGQTRDRTVSYPYSNNRKNVRNVRNVKNVRKIQSKIKIIQAPQDPPTIKIAQRNKKSKQIRQLKARTESKKYNKSNEPSKSNEIKKTQLTIKATTTQPKNLWDRIRLGFSLTIPNNKRMDREISKIQADPKTFAERLRRATPYLHFIVEETEKRNMPLEMALLPAIESGFKPRARSHMRALGLWQFIASTGKMMGLKRNRWYEGRYDIRASTYAALDHLQDLAEEFNGDWELALAAYNGGAGRIRRAVQANRRRGLATDFWSLRLRRETRRYVPKLLALVQVVKNPEVYGMHVPYLANKPYFRAITITKRTRLRQVAKNTYVSTKMLKRLNPGLRLDVVGVGGQYSLLLPIKQADQFTRLAKTVPDRNAQPIQTNRVNTPMQQTIPSVLPKIAHKRPITYIVKNRDSLKTIAFTYGLNPRQIAAWNGISPSAKLETGQVLYLHFWTNRTVPNIATKRIVYQVQYGDSLDKIAQRFGVSIVDLKRWNNLDTTKFKPGLKLTLHVKASRKSLL